jgi:mannosyl-oligosaccharide alpha-1,2-mannosidase
MYPRFLKPGTRSFQSGTDFSYGMADNSDSFYEYLLKMWISTGDERFREWYFESVEEVINQMAVTTADGKYTYIPNSIGSVKENRFHHLSCFAGGMLATGALRYRKDSWTKQLQLAVQITDTCLALYEASASGLGGEFGSFGKSIMVADKSYSLRPEVVESVFYMWRYTHDQKYRDWGKRIVEVCALTQSLEKHCRDAVGYHTIDSSGRPGDRMESFFLAETLKYLYLLFSDDDLISLDAYVFNTEAHPLSIRGYGRRKNVPTTSPIFTPETHAFKVEKQM